MGSVGNQVHRDWRASSLHAPKKWALSLSWKRKIPSWMLTTKPTLFEHKIGLGACRNCTSL
jgi:hypothetical protein